MSDVVVIGGGLIGMLTARQLATTGARVTVVERGEFGRESSWAGAGILSPLYPWRYPHAVNALSHWSQQQFPSLAAELAEETGIDPEWTKSGLLMLNEPFDEEAGHWIQQSGAVMEPVDGTTVAQWEPALSSHRGFAQWWPEVAQIRNPRFAKALARSLDLRGVVLKASDPVSQLITHQGRVLGVRAASGRLLADAVVVAAGAWSGDLLGPLAAQREITPVRGQMLMFKAPPGLLRRIVLSQGHYLVPRRDGRVLVGSTVEYAGFDKSTTAEAYRALREAARALAPALAEYPVERHWAGLRPGSRDGVPLIGEHPEQKGLYVNAGHFRNGVVTGPASARLLSDILLKRAPILDPAPYRPEAREPLN